MTKLFISYSRVDTEFTERIVERLRRVYGLPNVWYDDELHGGQHWWNRILEEVTACDVFVYLLSNESVTSPYCQAEFTEARRLQKPIVTIQIRDKTNLSDELSEIQYVDMKRGLNDENLARLIRSINELAALPKKRRALWTPPTPLPTIPDREATATDRAEVTTPTLRVAVPAGAATGDRTVARATIIAAIITGTLAIVAVIVGIVLPPLLNPTPTPPSVAQATTAAPVVNTDPPDLTPSVAQPTLTETPTATFTPSNTPTATANVPATQAIEFEASLTALGVMQLQGWQTATADAATRAAISQQEATLRAAGDAATANAIAITQVVLGETATQQSIEATRTRQAEIDIQNATATADAWTDTPTFTPTPTVPSPTPSPTRPTPTPSSTPDALQAALDTARSFTGSNTDWQALYPDGFIHTFDDGVPMVLVPVGRFAMGSTADEIDAALAMCQAAADNNATCDRLWIEPEAQYGDNTQVFSQPFWIDQTEVTRGQYQACVDAGQCEQTPASDYSTEANQPINRVTWFQAEAYCASRGARLPTEAEWEYAARGPDRWQFPWGNTFDGTRANHCDSKCGEASLGLNFDFVNEENDDGYTVTSPVGTYPAGASWVGALDMSGNVLEWTSSLYKDYPYGIDHESNIDTSSSRVLRSSSYVIPSFFLRTASRSRSTPRNDGRLFDADFGYGFRCARSS